MTPALIATLVTSVAALITAIGLWLRSRAKMNESFASLVSDKERTNKESRARFDEQGIMMERLKNDIARNSERTDNLERALESNTNGLKDDISDLRKETKESLSQLEDKLTHNQETTNNQIERVLNSQNASFLKLTESIAELKGAFNHSTRDRS